jgi:hypothetical protein
MSEITTTSVLDNQAIADATEGGHIPVDLIDYKAPVAFTMQSVNTAGTTPTLDLKLQHSNKAAGTSYALATAANVIDVELRESAILQNKIAATWTQSGAAQISEVVLVLKKNGTVSTTNLTLTIEGDSTGDPDGSAIGTATFSTDNVSSAYGGCTFTFSTPVEVADATTYHLVLASDYTSHADNNISWQAESGLTSGGNQTIYDATVWAADADDSQIFIINQYQFADVTGGAFTQATTTSTTETIDEQDFQSFDRYVRVHSTVTGTSTPAYYAGVTARGWKES